MADYLISPPEKPDWSIDADHFTEVLHDRWVVLDFARDADPEGHIDLEADILVDEEPVTLVLHRSGDAVGVYGSIRAAGEVALWVATLVPDDAMLWIYDESFSHRLTLTEDTTVTEIVAAFTDDSLSEKIIDLDD